MAKVFTYIVHAVKKRILVYTFAHEVSFKNDVILR